MAGIEEAFERFQDRLAKQESKKYSEDEEYTPMKKDPYPLKLGPLQLGANANITTGQYSPDEYQNISTMNRNLGVRGKLNIPDTGISLLGSMGDVRSSSKNKLNLPFNPMTGEAEPYSETMRNVYKQSPYSIGAQYNPPGTDQLFSALYNKGGGYNLGYNQGPVNVSYTSNPGLGNNIMLRGQYNFADGGVASMFRERPGYQIGGTINPFDPMQRPDDLGLPGEENLTEETLEQAMARGVIFYDPITGRQINRVGTREVGFDPNFISQRAMQAQQDAAARTLPINIPSVATPSNFLSPYQSMQQEILTRLQSIPTGGTTVSVSEGSSGISPLFRINRAIQAEQDAAARVTPTRMAEGGLTNTIPPVKGPDSQGVESLFRRRYN